jgi:hypothetical protein
MVGASLCQCIHLFSHLLFVCLSVFYLCLCICICICLSLSVCVCFCLLAIGHSVCFVSLRSSTHNTQKGTELREGVALPRPAQEFLEAVACYGYQVRCECLCTRTSLHLPGRCRHKGNADLSCCAMCTHTHKHTHTHTHTHTHIFSYTHTLYTHCIHQSEHEDEMDLNVGDKLILIEAAQDPGWY